MKEVIAQSTTEIEPFQNTPKLIDLETAAQRPFSRGLLSLVLPALEKVFSLDVLNRHYAKYYEKVSACKDPKDVFELCLDFLKAKYRISSPDLKKIPAKGPLVVVANHPFGGVEGVILGALLLQVRSDVKILGNYLLKEIAGIRETIIAVDPFERKNSVTSNLKGLKEAVRWVKAGGVLATFPAGEVSSFQLKERRVADPTWSAHIGGIIRRTKASALPVYFSGKNGLPFQTLGMLHPGLRTAMLPRELVNKKGKEFRIHVGKAIKSAKLQRFENDSELINYLRLSTYFLKNRDKEEKKYFVNKNILKLQSQKMEPIIAPVTPDLLRRDVERLPSDQRLVSKGNLAVYIARSSQLPNLLNEIGRLREVTFRDIDEGTGTEIDLDRFDSYYLHLFLWNYETSELVGAYRLGLADVVLKQYGPSGLYTNQLFRFKPELIRHLATSIECGRSFIRPEYQKKLNSLVMLWKGIGEYIARNPRYSILFGPVSISKDYHTVSKNLLVRFIKANKFDFSLSRFVAPRKPYRTRRVDGISKHILRTSFQDIDDISLLISEIEKDGKGIPILLKHYLNLNGNLLCFNVDKAFSDVVDGLFMVDLTTTDSRLLKHFMGKVGFERFVEYNKQIFCHRHKGEGLEECDRTKDH